MKTRPKPHPPAAILWWTRGWVFVLFILVSTLLAYLPVGHAGFLWDDDILITDNILIRQAGGWLDFWRSTQTPDYFPVTSTSFWLEWRLWGMNATGYHVTNVLLHAANAILLWRVLARLKIPGAKLAAAIFALHPVNVASVAWIAERKNTLAMLFFLVTLLLYLRFEVGKRWRWYWLAWLAFVLALLSKTAVAPLPVVLLGIAWWQRGRVDGKDMLRTVPFFAAAGLLALVTISFQYHNAIGHDIVRTDDFWSRLAVAGSAVWFYFYKAVVPLGLVPVYPRWPIGAVSLVSFLPGVLLAAGLFTCWRFRATWGRVLLFGGGYAVVMLLPVLGFLNIYFFRYSLVADHWQYFAIIGIITVVAAGITTTLSPFPQAQLVVSGAVLLTLGILTWRQASIYRNADTFWRATLAGNPDCAVAHDGLGYVLLQDGNTSEALTHFAKAVQISPGYALAHYDLGRALSQMGRLDDAMAQFQAAVQIKPEYAQAQNNLGATLVQKGDWEAASIHLQKALASNPSNAEACYNLGLARLHQGKLDDAVSELQRALQLKPDFEDAAYNLGVALLKMDKPNEAITQFQKTLQINPGNAEAHYNLGVLYQSQRMDDAIAQFQQTLQIKPDYAAAHNNLGGLLLGKGDVGGAIAQFEAVLKLDPRDVNAQNNLAWLLANAPEASMRDGKRAVELAQQASDLTGGANPTVLRTLAAALAEAGRFSDAVSTAQKGGELARSAGQSGLMEQFNQDVKRYEAGLPWHQ